MYTMQMRPRTCAHGRKTYLQWWGAAGIVATAQPNADAGGILEGLVAGQVAVLADEGHATT